MIASKDSKVDSRHSLNRDDDEYGEFGDMRGPLLN